MTMLPLKRRISSLVYDDSVSSPSPPKLAKTSSKGDVALARTPCKTPMRLGLSPTPPFVDQNKAPARTKDGSDSDTEDEDAMDTDSDEWSDEDDEVIDDAPAAHRTPLAVLSARPRQAPAPAPFVRTLSMPMVAPPPPPAPRTDALPTKGLPKRGMSLRRTETLLVVPNAGDKPLNQDELDRTLARIANETNHPSTKALAFLKSRARAAAANREMPSRSFADLQPRTVARPRSLFVPVDHPNSRQIRVTLWGPVPRPAPDMSPCWTTTVLPAVCTDKLAKGKPDEYRRSAVMTRFGVTKAVWFWKMHKDHKRIV